MTDRAKLKDLLAAAKEWYRTATREEIDAMVAQQRDGYAKAEASWPKPKFHYAEDGTKVYESYEDYCNG